MTTCCVLVMLAIGEASVHAEDARRDAAIERAIEFLAREVRVWREEKGCFSCHNNGDGVRALVIARRHGLEVPRKSLTPNAAWLRTPEKWHAEAADEPFKDPKLATVQFAAALVELQAGGGAGEGDGDEALEAAAEMLADFQDDDGAWHVDQSGLGGSPITYGDALATVMSRRTLAVADAEQFAAEIVAADRWLRGNESQRIVDAAAILCGLTGADDEAARRQRSRCLQLLLQAQAQSGGWGLFANRESEPFDTAMAVIALDSLDQNSGAADGDVQAAIDRGSEYLVEMQSPDGSWPETTRPAGGHSYALRVSTTAWAAIALMTARSR